MFVDGRGVGITGTLAPHGAQAEAFGRIIAGVFYTPIVQHKAFRPAAFNEQFTVVSALNGVPQQAEGCILIEVRRERAEGVSGHLGILKRGKLNTHIAPKRLFDAIVVLELSLRIWDTLGRIQRDSVSAASSVAPRNRHAAGGKPCAGAKGKDMRVSNFAKTAWTTMGLILAGAAANAQDVNVELPVIGAPHANGIGFQEAVTSIARDVHWLDGMLLWIITAIVLFVSGLMIWTFWKFNHKTNPKPAGFTHNSPLEIAWTVVPIIVLVFIGAFSLPVLFNQQEIPEGDITIKVTGYQWYWGYEYVDEGVAFESFMLAPEELADYGYTDDLYKLATDQAIILPVGKTVVMQLTGADVIHSWTIPAFGVKQDAVPGRLAQLWFNPEKEGIYFGQCSELCGKDHAYMPITVKVVSQEVYDAWLIEAKDQNGV
jgi:cytochrome c oxidase subunit 2